MTLKYDFMIVGAGLSGCSIARLLVDKGYSCLIQEKNDYVGGHCYDEIMSGILVQRFGIHVSHTNNKEVWDFLNRFAEFNQFKLKVYSKVGDCFYSFPINFLTLHQLFGVQTPEQAEQIIKSELVPCENPQNLEEYALSIMGKTLYETFIRPYTTKQWNTEPKNLPKEILGRVPFRIHGNDSYFAKHRNKYEGVPIGGYTLMMQKMINHPHITLSLGKPFGFEDRKNWRNIAHNLIYTGPIDQFFDYELGKLPYRSLKFEYEYHDVKMYQPTALVNYPSVEVPYTRITEHKHTADNAKLLEKVGTIISKEYPADYEETGEPYYPINTAENNDLYQQYYKKAVALDNVYFAGRLGNYTYIDTDQAVEAAMKLCEKL